jgi:hypothetical protein
MGSLVQTYDKAHLFDVEIPGKVRLKVRDILKSSGVRFGIVNTVKAKWILVLLKGLSFSDLLHAHKTLRNTFLKPVLWIRIRIRNFLKDPDPE